MGWSSKNRKGERLTQAPNPYMTPSQQLAYARKKREELKAERDPELLAAMKYNTTGYTTLVNGIEVGHGSRGIISFESVPKFPLDDDEEPETTIEQVKKSLLQSKKKFDNAFDRVHGKFGQITHYKRRNARRSQHSQRASRFFSLKDKASLFIDHSVSKSKKIYDAFDNFGQVFAKPLFFPFSMPREDEPDEEFYNQYHRVLDEKRNDWLNSTEKLTINEWLAEAGGEPGAQEPDIFATVTTAQLLGMEGAMIDGREQLKSYYGPPSSPEPEAFEDEYEDVGDWWSVQEQLLEEEVPDELVLEEAESEEEAEDKKPAARKSTQLRKEKDLLTYLGTVTTDTLLFKQTGDSSTYFALGNSSDFYGLPLLYPDYLVHERHHDMPGCLRLYDLDEDDLFDNMYSFREIPSYPPGPSLILFLRSRCLSLAEIAHELAALDEDFLRYYDSRWIEDYHVPEYWQMNNSVIENLRELVPRQLEDWELDGARDRFGKVYPDAYKMLKTRMHERKMGRMVVDVLEDHLTYRCARREIVKKDPMVPLEEELQRNQDEFPDWDWEIQEVENGALIGQAI